ncbi:hypothetical protein F2P81_016987 [Scophthalmus maximus]|uniref:Uncharacterized protein n=1 Tax=Scophthalmus maximus TaxID=52904 RepID=A0A6A4S4Y1_SCOMX|nr:hypothetical protein F2P81_016987 [Scophthalmus maximus]
MASETPIPFNSVVLRYKDSVLNNKKYSHNRRARAPDFEIMTCNASRHYSSKRTMKQMSACVSVIVTYLVAYRYNIKVRSVMDHQLRSMRWLYLLFVSYSSSVSAGIAASLCIRNITEGIGDEPISQVNIRLRRVSAVDVVSPETPPKRKVVMLQRSQTVDQPTQISEEHFRYSLGGINNVENQFMNVSHLLSRTHKLLQQQMCHLHEDEAWKLKWGNKKDEWAAPKTEPWREVTAPCIAEEHEPGRASVRERYGRTAKTKVSLVGQGDQQYFNRRQKTKRFASALPSEELESCSTIHLNRALKAAQF